MHTRTTLILLVVVLVLGAFILGVERRMQSTAERQAAARSLLVIPPEAVTHLELASGTNVIECQSIGGRWKIVRPVVARADEAAIRRVLYGLRALERITVLTRSELGRRRGKEEEYGLASPTAWVAYGDGRVRYVAEIGRVSPAGDSVYVRLRGKPEIMAVSRSVLDLLPASAADLRDRVVLPGAPEDVIWFELEAGEGLIRVVREERGRWRIAQPAAGRASRAAVQRFLNYLFMIRAAAFLPAGRSAAEFERPRLKVRAGLTGGEEVALIVGELADRQTQRHVVLARPDDAAVLVEAAQLEPLYVTLDALRDRRLTTLDTVDVNWIGIETTEKKIELRKDATGWKIMEPRRWKADDRKIADFLLAWTAPVIERFVAGDGEEPPQWVVRLGHVSDQTGAITDTTIVEVLGSKPSGARRVRLKPEGFVAEIPESLLAHLSSDPLFYRDRTVLSLDATQIVAIAVVRQGVTARVARAASGEFVPSADSEVRLTPGRVAALLEALRSVQALRFIPEEEAPALDPGFENIQERLVITLQGTGALAKVLLFGGPSAKDARYARLQGQEGLFELSADVCKALLPPFDREMSPRLLETQAGSDVESVVTPQ